MLATRTIQVTADARHCTVREYEPLDFVNAQEREELKAFQGVFKQNSNGTLTASKYVGVITTKRGTVIEILPKIDLGDESDPDHKKTKRLFLPMLRCWRGFGEKVLRESDIRALRRFPMLEVFVRQFLVNLNTLTRGGLARRYIPIEENLPYLGGRILFHEQIRETLINHARFYVSHDELSVNRPSNRLIHSTMAKLIPLVRNTENRRLLHQLMATFADVPKTANPHADWQRHQVDRSMQHYGPVMQWVGLFLFGHGLTTFAGLHRNLSLLFPMEQVFEDFVTYSFRCHQTTYCVAAQRPQKPLANIDGQAAFMMKPDISLRERKHGDVAFILDAKWKHINAVADHPKHGIDQNDLYQLYAYGKGYGCAAVALIYPQSQIFTNKDKLRYQILDDLTLICLPFDVEHPKESVQRSMEVLTSA